MTNYQEARVKLTNTQWNKLKSAAKNKTRTIIILDKKTLKMKNCHTSYLLKICQQTKNLVKLRYLKQFNQVDLLVFGQQM